MLDIQETPIDRAIRLMGGMVKTARLLGLNGHATVYQWTKKRVPADYCPLIEQATQGQVRCEELRPDVAWSVLRENGALPELDTTDTATAQQTRAQAAPNVVAAGGV